MGLKPGKNDAKKLYDLLDRNWDDIESMAMAIMQEAFEVYESKAKFVLVGQSLDASASAELASRFEFPAGTPDAERRMRSKEPMRDRAVCLGMFATKAPALTASRSLTYSAFNKEEPFQAYVLPIYNGTPAEFHKERKKLREGTHDEATPAERLTAAIRAAAPGAGPDCMYLMGLDENADFIHCARFKYHPGDHAPYEEAKVEPCELKVLNPTDPTQLAACGEYKYHPGPCWARMILNEKEAVDDGAGK